MINYANLYTKGVPMKIIVVFFLSKMAEPVVLAGLFLPNVSRRAVIPVPEVIVTRLVVISTPPGAAISRLMTVFGALIAVSACLAVYI